MMPGERMENAISAALRRRNPDPEIIEERNAILEEKDDWQGVCHFCRQLLKGTIAQIQAHRCPEYEASLGSDS
jgi:hypothetical protein